jgi:hypothetical protein
MRSSNPLEPCTVFGAVKARPGSATQHAKSPRRPALTAPARGAIRNVQAGTKERLSARTKELPLTRSTR